MGYKRYSKSDDGERAADRQGVQKSRCFSMNDYAASRKFSLNDLPFLQAYSKSFL